MRYAVIQSGGKQYKAAVGDILDLEHLDGEKDQIITFTEVLLVSEDGDLQIGTPHVNGVSVSAVIVDQLKGKKIRVAKFKAKTRYRRVTGHRQHLTKVRIEDIGVNKKESAGKKDAEKSPVGK